MTGATIAAVENIRGRIGRYRWVICALLFFATTINYVDRQVFGFLAPGLQRSIGWDEARYGWIDAALAEGAFIATGVPGFIWLLFWLLLYRRPEEHPRLSQAELAQPASVDFFVRLGQNVLKLIGGIRERAGRNDSCSIPSLTNSISGCFAPAYMVAV